MSRTPINETSSSNEVFASSESSSLHELVGVLYIVSTPIGNLEDMSFRAVRILKEVNRIAAEDTRHTGRLLKHFEIDGQLESYHDHNKEAKTPFLLRCLKAGENLAVVTDAGTPGISDPAFYLVRAAVEAGIPISPVPGPTAAIAALVASGLPTDRFVFEGFLPPKKGRKTRLDVLADEPRTIILYESPHRLEKTLSDLQQVMGDRQIVIAREITKKFEEWIRGTLSEVIEITSQRSIKGECVLLIHGRGKKVKQ
jgi:16S rRNA (cytidine1402-2'-O)-methyltransferase